MLLFLQEIHKLTFKLQRTANENAAERSIYRRPDHQKYTLSRHIEFCKADRTTRKLTLQDRICRSFLHGFAHVSMVGFLHPSFSLRDINVTLGLLLSRGHVIWRGSVSVSVHCQGSKTE